MRAFIVTWLFSLALAAPQGYSYQSGGQLQLPGISGISGISGVSGNPVQHLATSEEQRIVQQALQAPKLQQVLSGETHNIYQQPQQQIFHQPQQQQQLQLPTNFGYNLLPQQQQLLPQQQQLLPQRQQLLPQQQQLQPQQQQLQPQQQQLLPQQQQQLQSYNPHAGAALVSKDIYVHVPPVDDSEEHYPQQQFPVAPPRKHYRIVFIKAPTVSASKTALRVKQAPVEEKTIIYVLTKKPDPLELQTAIEEAQAPKQISKPEVFFIKYKTQEEAAHAQRTIQAQYDQLGGTTQVSDEGVAPVTSVIGALDSQRTNLPIANPNGNANVVGGLTGAIHSKYLPSHLRA